MQAGTKVANGSLTHSIPESCPAGVADVVSDCFAFAPDDRPDFDAITDALDAI